MRLSLRLILFLVVGITLVTFFISRNQVRSEKRGLRADLQRRAEILAESLQEIVEPALERSSRDRSSGTSSSDSETANSLPAWSSTTRKAKFSPKAPLWSRG